MRLTSANIFKTASELGSTDALIDLGNNQESYEFVPGEVAIVHREPSPVSADEAPQVSVDFFVEVSLSFEDAWPN